MSSRGAIGNDPELLGHEWRASLGMAAGVSACHAANAAENSLVRFGRTSRSLAGLSRVSRASRSQACLSEWRRHMPRKVAAACARGSVAVLESTKRAC